MSQTNGKSIEPVLLSANSSFDWLLYIIQLSQWKKSIINATKIYSVKMYNLEKLYPQRVTQIHKNLQPKYNHQTNTQTWLQNELRIFVWLLLTYSAAQKLSPDQFNESHWENLSRIFHRKPVSILQFQYLSLKKTTQKITKWSQEEDQLMVTIIRQKNFKNKWNEIAKQFYSRGLQYTFRSPKQCRERWNNYLDNTKSRETWTDQEDLQLLKKITEHGKKWALISKVMSEGRRTEHMVKNRFNSLSMKYLKQQLLKPLSLKEIDPMKIYSWLQAKLEYSTANLGHNTQTKLQYLQFLPVKHQEQTDESIKKFFSNQPTNQILIEDGQLANSSLNNSEEYQPILVLSPLANHRYLHDFQFNTFLEAQD